MHSLPARFRADRGRSPAFATTPEFAPRRNGSAVGPIIDRNRRAHARIGGIERYINDSDALVAQPLGPPINGKRFPRSFRIRKLLNGRLPLSMRARRVRTIYFDTRSHFEKAIVRDMVDFQKFQYRMCPARVARHGDGA